MIIGRAARANGISALQSISSGNRSRLAAFLVGFAGMITVTFILSFYSIVSGWMIAHFFDSIAEIFNLITISNWLTLDAPLRNSFFVILFVLLTVKIISAGVKDGIEMGLPMPSLLILLILLIFYVFSLPGAWMVCRVYLVPDFSQLSDPALLVDAMGQAFFSLTGWEQC